MSFDHDKIDRLRKDVFWEIARAQHWALGENAQNVGRHLLNAHALNEQLIAETSLDKVMGGGSREQAKT